MNIPQNPVAYHVEQLRAMASPNYPGAKPSIRRAEKVLDIGCGAGQTLIGCCPNRVPSDALQVEGESGCVLCKAPCGGGWAYGIDIDEAALRIGSQWSHRISFARGTADMLPYPNETFDYVISRVALPYADLQTAIREIQRVLRPGGRVWLVMHPLRSRFKRAIEHTWKGKLFFLYVLLSGIFFHFTLRTFSIFRYRESWQTRSAMLRLLRRSGFEDGHAETTEPWFVVTATRSFIDQ